ncbi:MAG: membrane protein insertion efficiency factor YidD [Nocardioides sp.]
MKYLLIGLLKAYRAVISPLYGEVCRYYPSCSHYALDAVREHGSVRGSWLAVRRLARCHPWAAGGVDHVPPRTARAHSTSTHPPHQQSHHQGA